MVHRLQLEVVPAKGEHFEGRRQFQLKILVDGRDVFAVAWGGMGRDPDALLGPASPLIPTTSPREVVIQRCSCGEEGCGSLVGRVRREADQVVWDDFREGSNDTRSPGKEMLGLGPFRFKADAYERELQRAHRDRPWESVDRLTARLVRERVEAVSEPLAAPAWVFDWAAASLPVPNRANPATRSQAASGVRVSLRNGRRQIVMDFVDDGAFPAERAANIVQALLHGDPKAWPVSFRGGALADWSGIERDLLTPGNATDVDGRRIDRTTKA